MVAQTTSDSCQQSRYISALSVDISVGVGAFVIGLSQISSFVSVKLGHASVGGLTVKLFSLCFVRFPLHNISNVNPSDCSFPGGTVIPIDFSFVHTERTGHPRHHINSVFQLLLWHDTFSSHYPALFTSWALSQPSSHGTDKSLMSMFLSSADLRTMSGLREIWITTGKTSLLLLSGAQCTLSSALKRHVP